MAQSGNTFGLAVGLLIGVCATPICSAGTVIVDLGGNGDYTKIQPAIDTVQDGDTVLVKPGEYVITEPLTFAGKAITVRGENGPDETTIRMSETLVDPARSSVVIFENGEDAGSVLAGFTLTGGTRGGVKCTGGSSPTLTNCTFSGNSSTFGGGVDCRDKSSPTLSDCTISGNSATDGGGVYCGRDSSPALGNCTISGNSATDGGGVKCDFRSSVTLSNCTISGNVAGSGRGGGVNCGRESSPTLSDCTISGNSARDGGGVYCDFRSGATLSQCTISGNVARNGGGVYCSQDSSPALTSCIVWDNVGGSIFAAARSTPQVTFCCIDGDGVWPGLANIKDDPLFCGGWAKGEVRVEDQQGFADALASFAVDFALSTLSPCRGTGEGGVNMGSGTGVCGDRPGESRLLCHLASGTYRIDGLTLFHRVSIEGMGQNETVIEGTVFGLQTGSVLAGVTVTAGTSGGVLIASSESPEIRQCRISGNSTGSGRGGGVYCSGDSSPTLRNCTISGNLAGSGRGGGVYCAGDSFPTLSSCMISGNSAIDGGGVYCSQGSSPTLTNCAVSGNSAGLGQGGGVYCARDSSPTLSSCTITGNEARRGGGGYCVTRSRPTVTNCILWGNPGGSITAEDGSSLSLTYSCVQGNAPWPGEGNMNDDPGFESEGVIDFNRKLFVDIDGTLRELPDFLVENPDYHLLSRSPAIDAGTSAGAPGRDFAGDARPCGVGVDMGVYEMGDCSASFHFLRGDCNGDGRVGGRVDDAAYLLSYNFLSGPEPPCFAACDANGDGAVVGQVADALYLLSYGFLAGNPPPAPFPECGEVVFATDTDLGCENPPVDCQR